MPEGTGDGGMRMLAKKAKPHAAKWWHPIMTALVGLAVVLINSKADAVSAGQDPRDKDLIQMQKALDQVLKKLQEDEKDLAVLRAILEERTHRMDWQPRSLKKLPDSVKEVPVAESEVKAYQQQQREDEKK